MEQDTVNEETSYEAAEEESDPGGVKHLTKTKAWSWQKRCWNYSLDGKNHSCYLYPLVKEKRKLFTLDFQECLWSWRFIFG